LPDGLTVDGHVNGLSGYGETNFLNALAALVMACNGRGFFVSAEYGLGAARTVAQVSGLGRSKP